MTHEQSMSLFIVRSIPGYLFTSYMHFYFWALLLLFLHTSSYTYEFYSSSIFHSYILTSSYMLHIRPCPYILNFCVSSTLLIHRGASPTLCRARFTVFFSSIAMVIGPTPPGTGVMAAARSLASSNWTSPVRR